MDKKQWIGFEWWPGSGSSSFCPLFNTTN